MWERAFPPSARVDRVHEVAVLAHIIIESRTEWGFSTRWVGVALCVEGVGVALLPPESLVLLVVSAVLLVAPVSRLSTWLLGFGGLVGFAGRFGLKFRDNGGNDWLADLRMLFLLRVELIRGDKGSAYFRHGFPSDKRQQEVGGRGGSGIKANEFILQSDDR